MEDALQRLVEQLENGLLLKPTQLRRRLEALDLLDAYFPDTLKPASGDAESNAVGLYGRARSIYATLEAVNCELFEGIRSEIRRGGTSNTLLHWTRPSAEIEDAVGPVSGMGYDYLDDLISGVFQFEEPDAEPVRRESEMVFYQPTPARHIFSLIARSALTASDVFIDLGSGLGHVPLLVSICTPACSVGIELETFYVERARQCAQGLNLNRVKFIQHDVRGADLSIGTVFYLYTPFKGSILSCVLKQLRLEAATRQIRICSYGPCTSAIAEESWLEASEAPESHRIALFRSRT